MVASSCVGARRCPRAGSLPQELGRERALPRYKSESVEGCVKGGAERDPVATWARTLSAQSPGRRSHALTETLASSYTHVVAGSCITSSASSRASFGSQHFLAQDASTQSALRPNLGGGRWQNVRTTLYAGQSDPRR